MKPTMPQDHEAVRLLERLIGIPSLSRKEGPIADFLISCLADRGVSVNRHDDNIYFVVGSGRRRLLFNTHLDVVPPSTSHPFDPFSPTMHEGFLWGRGAVDAKSSVAAMVTAALELSDEGWPDGDSAVVVALTTCEELGGQYNGLEALLPHLPAFDAALVGEPTELKPCTAQKGLLILNVVARGRAAHAARASLGENAITKVAYDLRRLDQIGLDREDPLLGPVTITPTVISGGDARNTVPDECTVTLDIRSTPSYTHAELFDLIASALDSDVLIHSDRLSPVHTVADEPIVKAATAASGASPFGSPTMSDWIFLAGTPTVKIGPGSSELSHTSDERIRPDEIVSGVAVYREIATRYFQESGKSRDD